MQLTSDLKERFAGIVETLLKDLSVTEIEEALTFAKTRLTTGAPVTCYPITVNYDLTMKVMIKAGKYNYANPDITAEHFSVTEEGQADISIELVHFDRRIESDEAIRELDRMGLRPATLPELLAFGARHPDVQREFPIVALGSVWQSRDGNRYVPYLWSDSGERHLYLGWFEVEWFGHYRFAAVRK